MTTGVQRRRGTTVQHSTFTGLEGEITVDTTKDTAVVHDGTTVGGHPLAKQSLSNVDPTALDALTGSNTASGDLFLVYDVSTSSLKKITRDELNNAIEQDALANVTITGGSINGTTVGASTASTGAFTTLSASGAFSANGGVTLGDASGDALTINSSAVSIPNGLNFDSNTLVIDATNNRVGVGVASPSQALSVQRTGSGDAITWASSTGKTAYAYADGSGIGIFSGASVTNTGFYANDTSNYFAVYTSSTERMRINSSGNVGIGTSSPSTLLHVSGSGVAATFNRTDNVAVISLQYNGTQGGFIGTTGAGITTFYDNTGSEKMRITSTGDVGIGTSSPTNKLTVNGSIGASGSNGAFSLYRRDTNAYAVGLYSSSGGLLFDLSGVGTALTLDSSGNLGLGVTPSAWFSTIKAFQFASTGSLEGRTNSGSIALASNSYIDTSGDTRYITTNYASRYQQNAGQHIWYNAPSGTAGNAITFTQAMTLDASGNLAIGTTSAAGGSKLTVAVNTTGATVPTDNLVAIVDTQDMALGDGGGIRFGGVFTTGGGTNADMGYIKAYKENATSGNYSYALTFGTRANGSNPAERMRIDSSGNLLVGTTSTSNSAKMAIVGGSLAINQSSAGNAASIIRRCNNVGSNGLSLQGNSADTIDDTNPGASIYIGGGALTDTYEGNIILTAYGNTAGGTRNNIVFQNRSGTNTTTERMRIASNGDTMVNKTTTGYKFAVSGVSTYGCAQFDGASSTALTNMELDVGANNTTQRALLVYSAALGNDTLYIYSNGNVVNRNSSYGALSDVKLKENIVDATPKLEQLCQVKIRNYNLIGSEIKQIGVVAQELETIFPSMVDESPDIDKEGNDLGTTTKSVKYSVFVPMLIKAIQELKAEVDSLKAQLNK